jgi:hypothetical protein
MTDVPLTKIHSRCRECRDWVVILFQFWREGERAAEPRWVCPACGREQLVDAIGRVVSVERSVAPEPDPV